MKKSQIKFIIESLGYEMGTEIPLKEVSSISLSTDSCVYPGDDIRLKFDNTEDLLLIYNGYTKADGTFVKNFTLPSTIISYDIIEAFNMKNIKHIEAPYREGRTV